jgi:hypothetical protein
VLRCTLPQTEEYHNQQLSDFQGHLSKIQTPPPVVEAIMTGFKDWITPPQRRSRVSTFSSLMGPDTLVTSAYYEQFHRLGWFRLCLGRISLKWSRAAAAYHTSTHSTFNGDRWAAAFILLVWKITRQLWHHRNQIVHGAMVEEVVSTQLSALHDKVTQMYWQYQETPSCILPHHEYLFTKCSLEHRLKMSYDSITCWIRSVEEACTILEFQQDTSGKQPQLCFKASGLYRHFQTMIQTTILHIPYPNEHPTRPLLFLEQTA